MFSLTVAGCVGRRAEKTLCACEHSSPTFSSQCSEDKGRDRLLSFNYTSIIPHFIFTTEKIKARLHSLFATAFKLDLIKTSFLEHPPFLSPATETFTCVRKCTVGFQRLTSYFLVLTQRRSIKSHERGGEMSLLPRKNQEVPQIQEGRRPEKLSFLLTGT